MLNEYDNKIIAEIDARIASNPDYWSFKEITKKTGIHSFTRYPATMVPQMLEVLISIIAHNSDTKNLLDPFMGSGTVLVEGLKNNLNVFGVDINPLSYLMCNVKLQYISISSIKAEIARIKEDIEIGLPLEDIYEFNNIDKWFRSDIKLDLSRLRTRILAISNSRVRNFCLVNFADIITEVKNSQSSTFKLHSKKSEKIAQFEYSVLYKFVDKMTNSVRSLEDHYLNLRLAERGIRNSYGVQSRIACKDNRELKKALKLSDGEIDLIVTSPPYGDNSTTVTYGQFSILPLLWVMNDALQKKIDDTLLRNFSAIDKDSLGGRNYTIEQIQNSRIRCKSDKLNLFIKKLEQRLCEQDTPADEERINDKIRKACSFVIDYHDSLKQQIDVLKTNGYMVLVVGNRRIHNYEFPFDEIVQELLSEQFIIIKRFTRSICNKRIASRISMVREDAVNSMSEETVLVLRKK